MWNFLRRVDNSLDNPKWISDRAAWLYWKIYNFSWNEYYFLFDNSFARVALPSSLIGYLLYLNDVVTKNIGFDFITNKTASTFGLSLHSKLYFLYFGLLFIALARLIFLIRRPICILQGPSRTAWVNFGLKEFTYSDFSGLNADINRNGHRTTYGKYYDDDWAAFKDDAIWNESGKAKKPTDVKRESRRHVDFTLAKSRHEDLLRSILLDRYEEYSAKNKISLFIAVTISILGYGLFLVPNLDLTLTIVRSIF